MQNRIKQIRKAANLNQEEFGKRIGIKQSTITAYECGNRVPLDVTITAICREFNVNETWLRTGEGAMHPPATLAEEAGQIAREASKENPEEAYKFFHSLVDGMTEAEIVNMYTVFKRWQSRQQ